jgi:hypothetical protein
MYLLLQTAIEMNEGKMDEGRSKGDRDVAFTRNALLNYQKKRASLV